MKTKEEQPARRERGTGRLYQRHEGGVWWCQYSVRGCRIRLSTRETDERKAEKFLKKRLAEVLTNTHRDAGNLRFEDLRNALVADALTNGHRAIRTDEDGIRCSDAVRRLSPFFAGYRASEIDADAIRAYQQQQLGLGLANATVNRSISALRRMFNLARKEGRLRDVPFFPMLREAPPRSGFVEREQYERLFAALPDYLQTPLAIGFWCGMRKSEVLNLKWEQVDFLAGTIRLEAGTTKNGEGRTIPVPPSLRSLLLERRGKREGCEYVCFRKNRLGHVERVGSFRKAWQSACCKLGLGKMEPADGTEIRKDRPRGKPRPRRVYRGLIFHDLRRSAVRNLVRSGTPEKTAMSISGHKTRSVFDRYNIVSEDDVVDAGKKLEKYFAREKERGDEEAPEAGRGLVQ